jgi:NADH:ubiquinone oxidoreductase subunit
MSVLEAIFLWWRGATAGTWFTTWLSGCFVGEDTFGNRYYENRSGTRRWVIYNGTVEASRVPPDWHGWLHHTFKEPPTVLPPKLRPWEKEHQPNMTGTDGAYHPPGSLAANGEHPSATGDYEPWTPK